MPFPQVPEDCVAISTKVAKPVKKTVDVYLTCTQSTDLESLDVVSIDSSKVRISNMKIVDNTNVEITVSMRIDFTFNGQSKNYPFNNAKASCQATHDFVVEFAPSSELIAEECSALLDCSAEVNSCEFVNGILTIGASIFGSVTCIECKPEIVIVKRGE